MRFIASGVAVGIFVLLGCADHTTPTDISDTPLLNFANGPDEPGLVVVRWGGVPQGLIFAASGMRAFHGVDPRDICTPGGFYNDLWDFQIISHPDDDGRRQWLVLGSDLITSVWPLGYGCTEYLTNDPLAEGTSHFQRIDHWPGETNSPRVHIWQAQGQLVRPGGKSAHYNGYSKFVLTRSGQFNWHRKIDLK